MQRVRHLLDARMFQPFPQNRQSFVQRHAGLQQMRELLSENEQLAVRNFQALRRRGGFGRAQQSQFSLKCVRLACFCFCGLSRFYHIDPNRDALLRFNLMDRNGAICAVKHPFN